MTVGEGISVVKVGGGVWECVGSGEFVRGIGVEGEQAERKNRNRNV
jgi:hypothetical protein